MSWMEEKNCDFGDEMTGKNEIIVNIPLSLLDLFMIPFYSFSQ